MPKHGRYCCLRDVTLAWILSPTGSEEDLPLGRAPSMCWAFPGQPPSSRQLAQVAQGESAPPPSPPGRLGCPAEGVETGWEHRGLPTVPPGPFVS